MGITLSGRFILASASPRRSELLKRLGLEFEVIPGDIDETFRATETPQEHVLRLSGEKALVIAHRHPDAWILGADTIVVIAGEVLGKPGSREEARTMLGKLSGREHEVFTGFSIVRQDRGNRISEVVRSSVLFRDITDDEMAWYTATDEPYDKAGAYAVQGLSSRFIRKIDGSYTNVMGLPLDEVTEALRRIDAIGCTGEDHGRRG
jgi:septum formation protein